MSPRISLVCATYQRAPRLAATLDALRALDGWDEAELIVVDNGSCDETPAVLERAARDLPLRTLVEPASGKNRALNTALRKLSLAPLVVFCDDDFRPEPGWLREIAAVAARWPRQMVFAGRVGLDWPREPVPDWARRSALLRQTLLGELDHGEREGFLPPGAYPAGVSFWMRRELLDEGLRFAPGIGPQHRPGFPLGSEAELFDRLARRGFRFVYAPRARIWHEVSAAKLTVAAALDRFERVGRGWALRKELPADPPHRLLGGLARLGAVLEAGRGLLGRLDPDPVRRLERACLARRRRAYLQALAARLASG